MNGVLSLPVLLLLGWGIAGLLWWDHRRSVIQPGQVVWTMAAMALVALAMILAIASVPAPPLEQLVRVGLLVEGVYGFVVLARRKRGSDNHGR